MSLKRTLTRVGLAALVVGLVAAPMLHDFNEVPSDPADDYREDAQPAATEITDQMDLSFLAFDDYLISSSAPQTDLERATSYGKVKRLLEPTYDATQSSLARADEQIERARRAIDENAEALTQAPEGAGDGGEEVGDAQQLASDYVADARRWLKRFERFVNYEMVAVELRRGFTIDRRLEELPNNASSPAVSAAAAADLQAAQERLDRRQGLKPPKDTKALYENELEAERVQVQYLEAVNSGIDSGDTVAISVAERRAVMKGAPLAAEAAEERLDFAADSGLARAVRSLSDRADELEDAIAKLGDGSERVEPDRTRPTASQIEAAQMQSAGIAPGAGAFRPGGSEPPPEPGEVPPEPVAP